jgi:hypothetical protein
MSQTALQALCAHRELGVVFYALYRETFAYRHPLPWGALHAHERDLWGLLELKMIEVSGNGR